MIKISFFISRISYPNKQVRKNFNFLLIIKFKVRCFYVFVSANPDLSSISLECLYYLKSKIILAHQYDI